MSEWDQPIQPAPQATVATSAKEPSSPKINHAPSTSTETNAAPVTTSTSTKENDLDIHFNKLNLQETTKNEISAAIVETANTTSTR